MHQPEFEMMERDQLEALQVSRLRDLVQRVYENVPAYRTKFDTAGVSPGDVNALTDVANLPFTVKDDLRAAYPYQMFAVPLSEIVRVHSSSGTTGQITVVGYTREDIDDWSDMVARAIGAAGLGAQDVMQVAYGYGLFTGGLGLHYGAERIGATAVPVSGGNTRRQVQILQDFGVTGLACTPSYALVIAEQARELGVDTASLPVRAGIFGAEPWTEQMRDQLQRELGIKAYDIYGLSEVMGPGVGYECEAQAGLHINEDHFLVEVVDPETLEVLPDGEYGEVVFTTLTKRGIPLIRYRTRDISRIIPGECSCGRTFRRLQRLTGRSDDMLIIRGVNVYPSQIEQVLVGVRGVSPHYQIFLTKDGSLDAVEVRVELDPEFDFDEIRSVQTVAREIRAAITSSLAISVEVRIVEPKSLARSEGKIPRVVDLRNKEA